MSKPSLFFIISVGDNIRLEVDFKRPRPKDAFPVTEATLNSKEGEMPNYTYDHIHLRTRTAHDL